MNQLFYSKRIQRTRCSERGMVLIVTLLIMVAMLLVSTALLRSTGTSIQVVNNLSFRQAAEAPANVAVELAMVAISSAVGGALPDCPGNGFYTFRQTGESPEGIPAILLNAPMPGDRVCSAHVSDMVVTFIVEPMCASDIVANGTGSNNCLLSRGGGGSGSGDLDSHIDGGRALGGGGGGGGGGGPVYRVSMRVDGVKNTTVFAQAFI